MERDLFQLFRVWASEADSASEWLKHKTTCLQILINEQITVASQIVLCILYKMLTKHHSVGFQFSDDEATDVANREQFTLSSITNLFKSFELVQEIMILVQNWHHQKTNK